MVFLSAGRLLMLGSILAVTAPWSNAADAPRVRADVFFYETPSSYALSPGGRWLAFVQRQGGRTLLYTHDMATDKGFQLNGVEGELDQLTWVDESRLAVRARQGGYTKLFQTDPQGAVFWDFSPKDNCVTNILENQPPPAVSGRLYFELFRDDGTAALYAWLVREAHGGRFPLLRVSRNPQRVDTWLFTPEGAIAGGIGTVDDRRVLWVAQGGDGFRDEWSEALAASAEEFPAFTAFGCPAGSLLASGYFGGEHRVVRRFDLAGHSFGESVLDPREGELEEVLFSADRRKIAGYLLHDRFPKMAAVDADFRRWTDQVKQQLRVGAEHTTVPIALSQNSEDALIRDSRADSPPAFWQVDLRGRKNFPFFLPPEPAVRAARPMDAWAVRARDGLELPCFKIEPAAGAPGSAVVLFVGGGPFEGVHQGWAPLLQFFAANGMTAVAMNYRGATGFGRAFRRAGVGQAGTGMVNDVADVLGAIGRAEWGRDRPVAIVAFSFGGYLALRAAAQEADRVQSVALINPLLNVADFFRGAVQHGSSQGMADYERTQWFGDHAAASVELDPAAIGPQPLLVLQSAWDAKVSPDVARRFVETAQRAGRNASLASIQDVHDIELAASWREVADHLWRFVDERTARSATQENHASH